MQSLILSGLKRIATLKSRISKQNQLFILIYHRVLDAPDFMRPWEVDKQQFSWQMELLATHFNALPLHDDLQQLKNNTLPSLAVAITFDDGYADNLLNAAPILKKHNLNATFFIASGYLDGGRMWNDTVIETIRTTTTKTLDLTAIGLGCFDISTPDQKSLAAQKILQKVKYLDPLKRQACAHHITGLSKEDLPNNLMLTTEQLRHLQQSGMEIGGHTVTHPILANLNEAEAKWEILENKQTLETLLGASIRYFAYPNGKPIQDYSPEQIGLVKQSGYLSALSTQAGVANKRSDLWQLPRFTPWDKSPITFMTRMIKLYSSY